MITGGIIYSKNNTTKQTLNYDIFMKPINRGNPSSGYTAFACNVDWGNEVIEDILNILKEKDTKITFFVTGRWAKLFPEIFDTIIKEGHEIGSHGNQHLDYGTLSFEENKSQIEKAEEIILKQTGVKPILFAPPSGAYNNNTLQAASELGYKTILWTIDTIDWKQGSTKDIILKRVLDKPDHNGAIILMHPMPETAKALPYLIDELKLKNLKVGTVSNVLSD